LLYKASCIDIFPTIFILTEYLKSIYGSSVKDNTHFKDKNEITFKDNDELEIYCLPNWEVSKIKTKIDHLHNAHSFVEMSLDQLTLYNDCIFEKYVKSASFLFYNRNIEERTLDYKVVLEKFSVNFKEYNLPLIEHFKEGDTLLVYNK
jgi:putative sugar O-methyltransferase